jgi:hypothetical protein
MVTAGITAGYLASPRLRDVHWQAAGRAVPGPLVSVAGESAQFTDPDQIPAAADVARLGRALAAGRRGDLDELMAHTAAYTGLRQGELFALTAGQVAAAARVITVDRKVVEVGGKLFLITRTGRSRPFPHPPSTPPHDGHASSPPASCRSTSSRSPFTVSTTPPSVTDGPPRGFAKRSRGGPRLIRPAHRAGARPKGQP